MNPDNTIMQAADQALREAQRAVDYTQILNVFSAHLYYMLAQAPREELQQIWAAGRSDLVFCNARGREAIEAQYVQLTEYMQAEKLRLARILWPESSLTAADTGIGDLTAKAAASPYVIIAEDGLSAHGIWFVPGVCSEIDHSGQVKADYCQEKNAVDFVKEDGEWKILRLDIYIDFQVPMTCVSFEPDRYEFDLPAGTYPPPYSARRTPASLPALPEPRALPLPAPGPQSSIEEKLDFAEALTGYAEAYREIQNTMSGFTYYLRVQKQKDAFSRFWSERDDISFAGAEGRPAVEEFLVRQTRRIKDHRQEIASRVYGVPVSPENDGIGDFESRAATTPYIIISGDLQTAQARWFLPGLKIGLAEDGSLYGRYLQEQLAADLVFENESWKFLHLQVYPDFTATVSSDLFEDRYSGRTFDMQDGPDGRPRGGPARQDGAEQPEKEAFRPGKPYGPTKVPHFLPPLPEPYPTWTEEETLPIMNS